MLRNRLSTLAALACAVVLAAGMVACAAKPAEVDDAASRNPVPHVKLADVETGRQEWDSTYGTSDVWYKDGDKSKGGVWFTPCDSGYGVLSIDWIDENGYLVVEQLDRSVHEPRNSNQSEHLVSRADVEPAYDIIFVDALTLYEAKSDSWYIRGDKPMAELKACFADKTIKVWGSDTDFAADGTFVFHGSKEEKGTWEITSPNVVALHFEGDANPEVVRFTVDGSGTVATLDD